MNDEETGYPAVNLARSRAGRCFIQALFTAGVSLALVNLFEMVASGKQAYLFFLILAVAFAGAQIQERMRRLSAAS